MSCTPPATPLPRRRLLRGAAAGALALLGACAGGPGRAARPRVVVVGGGFGGATAAHYLRRWSAGAIDVVLVEPDAGFVSCPLSNLVIGGSHGLDELSRAYTGLERAGVQVVRDTATAIDPAHRRLSLAAGAPIGYDRLLLSPGVELMVDAVPGLRAGHDAGRWPTAWRAGAETLALRRQLEAMPDGGVYAITVPEAPYRCPPGPYERACQVASYFAQAKPRSKVLILDANPDVTSKAALFKAVWAQRYPGLVEYRPQHRVLSVAPAGGGGGGVVEFEVHEPVRADVLNLLPPMRAGALAVQAGLANVNARWCGVDFRTFASRVAPGIHVIGDAIQAAPLMPKSGHMANAHAKVAAAAIVAELAGREPDPAPTLTNTCYSFIDATEVIHVASVHAYSAAEATYLTVPGSGGVSTGPSALEGRYAWNWAHSIWADLGLA